MPKDKRLALATALLAVLCLDGQLAGQTPQANPCLDPNRSTYTGIDCFKLWSACQPMQLVVEDVGRGAEDIGLTRERIQTISESRLRAARLYGSEEDRLLYVQVGVVGQAFSIHVGYRKWLLDESLGHGGMAQTWTSLSTGTHGRDAGYILQGVSEHTDRFIVEYLRVNEPDCE